jgi:hypothetical protein
MSFGRAQTVADLHDLAAGRAATTGDELEREYLAEGARVQAGA